jgi:hypothetical protein
MDDMSAAAAPGAMAGEADQAQDAPGRSFLNPFVIARVGGEPAMLVTELGTPRTAAALEEADRLRVDLEARRTALCDGLEEVFRAAEDKRAGQRIIQLKRDIYNCRGVALHPDIVATVPESVLAPVAAFLDDARRLAAHRDGLAALYAGEVQAKREALRTAWGRDNLRASILFSSRFLHEQLSKLMSAAGALPGGKKVAHACDSLLSYAARASLKASPLSAFTLVWVGKWTPRGQKPARISADALPYRRDVDVKHAAVLHALEPVWASLDTLGDAFPLVLNPTARQEEGKLAFTQVYRSAYLHPRVWGHNGPEVAIGVSKSVALLFNIFRAAGGAALSGAELSAKLAAAEPDPAKARAFIAKLVDLQLLLPRIDRHEQEPLLPWLLGVLAGIAPERGVPLSALVRELQAAVALFESAPEAERGRASAEIERLLHALAAAAGANPPAQVFSPLVYEDCFVSNDRLELDADALGRARQDLSLLLDIVPALDFNHVMQSLLSRKFIERFGAGGVCEDARGFMQEVTRDYFGPESELDLGRMAKLHQDQIEFDVGRSLHEVRRKYFDQLAAAPGPDGVVRVDRDAVRDLAASFPDAVKARPLSQCFTGQFAMLGDGSETFVLNQTFPGGSNLMSRFFTELDEGELGELKAYMRRLAPTGDYAEVPAVYGFNANIHPRLADAEIQVPGFLTGRSDTRKLPLQQLTITHSPDHDRLVLRHGGKPLDPFYFGFLSPSLLPRTLRPLTITSTQNLIFYAPNEREKLRAAGGAEMVVSPRIMFGSICLARRRQIFPKALRPDFELDDCAFFEAVWRWRQQWDVPRRAYYRLLPDLVGGAAGQHHSPRAMMMAMLEGQRQFDPTAFKPSYIDFDDPLYVRLFRRTLARNAFDLSVEEPLPGPDMHGLSVGGERHLCEYQIELSRLGRKIA